MASEANRIDDVSKLSNSQLFDELQRLGISAGPVVDSTRSVYEKKLLTKLSELRQSPISSIRPTSGSPNNAIFRENDMDDYESEKYHNNTTHVFRNSSESVDSLNLDDTIEEVPDLNYSFTKRQTTPPASSIFQSNSGSGKEYIRLSATEIVEDIRRRAALASRIQSRPSYRASESYQQGQFSGRVGKSETVKNSKINSTVIKILVGLVLFGIFYYVMTYTVEKPKIEYKSDAEKILEESGFED